MYSLIILEHVLVLAVTGSEDDELYSVTAYIVHDPVNQIKTLLVCESGYDSYYKLILILRKSTFLLQFDLVDLLELSEVIHAVVLIYLWICCRIPYHASLLL